MTANTDDTWAILKSLPAGPESIPRGYEFLPDAFKRDVEPKGPDALETVCQALSDGDVVAMLQGHLGHWQPVPQRIWRKYPLHRKVYPRFSDGKMRVALHEHEGPYLVGWVFVPAESLANILSQPASRQPTKFSLAQLEVWYQGYVADTVSSGKKPSREDDHAAACAYFNRQIPREPVRGLRRRFAPSQWQRGGRRPEKTGRK